MKWFQPIECDNTVDDPLVCDHSNFEKLGYDENDFRKGKRISRWNSKVFLQAKEKADDGDPDDALQNSYMLPIYSQRLVDALKEEKISGIQYLPVRILRPNKREIKGFSIANFLNFVAAFNYEKSDYDRFKEDFPNINVRGKLAGVKKFVLHEKELGGLDIIRLKDYNLRFFFSENVKKVFEDNKFTGYSFIEVELT